MIYHDRVTVHLEIATGETDSHGNPVYTQITESVPAEVFPLGTEATLDGSRTSVISRYRVVLAPRVEIPANIGNGLRMEWEGLTQMYVDGSVERHVTRGRLHHYELITKAVIG